MKIGADNLYAQMQSLAAQAGTPIQSEVAPVGPKVENANSSTFGKLLNQAVENVNELGHKSKEMTNRFEMGDQSVSLADVMIAKGKAGIAFEATVHVRNKVMEAYDKISNMPV
ncbi:flagellar hook-basal body complex protein FliE [Catenovulum sediminis]|uniref:Flagellar hook-basal body complex protein FliE n=1 Tax=Catenovulum sediminis TaxID=1740262 RepID=A0ABV1RGZ6_9ALTE|nr:flagellar hook-basal body complex protein FliE [Catenovulum sediminis]